MKNSYTASKGKFLPVALCVFRGEETKGEESNFEKACEWANKKTKDGEYEVIIYDDQGKVVCISINGQKSNEFLAKEEYIE